MSAEKPLFVGYDLDYMLLDTDKFFYDGVLPVLSEAFGLRAGVFRNQMNQFRRKFGPANDYDFFGHVAMLGLSPDEVEGVLTDKVKGDHLLRPGAKQLLEIQRANGSTEAIVTLGETRYQHFKVGSVPALEGIPVHAIREPKGPYMARMFPDEEGYHVDDQEIHGQPAGIKHIQVISRKTRHAIEGAYSDIPDLLAHGPADLVQLK